jgi:hypothetical protein
VNQGRIEFWKSGCRQEIQEIQEFRHLRLQIGLRLSIVAVQIRNPKVQGLLGGGLPPPQIQFKIQFVDV